MIKTQSAVTFVYLCLTKVKLFLTLERILRSEPACTLLNQNGKLSMQNTRMYMYDEDSAGVLTEIKMTESFGLEMHKF